MCTLQRYSYQALESIELDISNFLCMFESFLSKYTDYVIVLFVFYYRKITKAKLLFYMMRMNELLHKLQQL